MIIINFSDTSKQAFTKGFSKGIAAPLMLFGHFSPPNLPEVKQISPPSISDKQALNNDWLTIGADFNNVIASYGQKHHTEK